MELKYQYNLKNAGFTEEDIEMFDNCEGHHFIDIPVFFNIITQTFARDMCCSKCNMNSVAAQLQEYSPKFWYNSNREKWV